MAEETITTAIILDLVCTTEVAEEEGDININRFKEPDEDAVVHPLEAGLTIIGRKAVHRVATTALVTTRTSSRLLNPHLG